MRATAKVGQLTAYDLSKEALRARGLSDGPAMHVLASTHGAFWATTLAMPLDVLMARVQADPAAHRGRAFWASAAAIARAEGAGVFVRGWLPMFVRLAPMHVVGATLFEQARRFLGVAYFE